jgi:hypothetical protein
MAGVAAQSEHQGWWTTIGCSPASCQRLGPTLRRGAGISHFGSTPSVYDLLDHC